MRQSLIGGLIGGMVVVLLLAAAGRFTGTDEADAENGTNPMTTTTTPAPNWQISPYRTYGQPIDPTPAAGSPYVKQDSTNCTDPKNLFTCSIP